MTQLSDLLADLEAQLTELDRFKHLLPLPEIEATIASAMEVTPHVQALADATAQRVNEFATAQFGAFIASAKQLVRGRLEPLATCKARSELAAIIESQILTRCLVGIAQRELPLADWLSLTTDPGELRPPSDN